jgi:type I restriction enzyme S subunit
MAELRQIGQLMVGATPQADGEPTIEYVRAGSISEVGTVTGLTPGAEPSRGREARLTAGDVVVRARGVPAAAMVDQVAEGAYPTNDVLLFRADQAKVDPAYLAALLNLPTSREALSAGSQGAALSRLSVQALGDFEIPLPSLETQRKIAAVADCMRAEQAILERLRELRQQLNHQILQQLLGNAHGKGGYPRRGRRQASRHAPAGPSSPGSKEF